MSPSIVRARYNGCERKVAHATPESAQREADRFLQTSHERLDVYECPWTDDDDPPHWHVGHPPRVRPVDLPPLPRIRARLAIVEAHQYPTAWQHAYAEDVRWLLAELGQSESGADHDER